MLSRVLPMTLLVLCVAGCDSNGDPGPDPGAGDCEPSEGDAFRTITEGPGGAFMSVWGRSSGDVYAVGGDPGLGTGPTAHHLKQGFWHPMATAGAAGALNWVFGPGDDPDDPVWMVGANGTILRHDPATGDTVREDAPVDADVMFWGVWGAADDDLWAVGGAPEGYELLHRTAAGWASANDSLPGDLAPDVTLFKVWGEESGDLWVVGSKATALRRPAGESKFVHAPLPDGLGGEGGLLTVHGGAPAGPVIVGPLGDGTLLRWNGADLVRLELPEGSPQGLNGVRVGPSVLGDLVAVGGGALIHGPVEGPLELKTETHHELHAVWIDEKCEVWAAGGDLTSENVGGDGILLHYGAIIPKKMHRGL